MANNASPVASAPAFVILLGLCAAIWTRCAGLPAPAALAVSLSAAAAWIFLGSRRAVVGFAPELAVMLLLLSFLSVFSFYSMSKQGSFPSTVDTEARVASSRKWGRSAALLLDTPYGRAAAYVPAGRAAAEGSLVNIRAAVFDFDRSERSRGFDEFLFWHAKGALKKLVTLDIRTTAPPSGLARWRGLLAERIKETLPERMAGYMLALTVGARDEKLSELHRNTGTLHLLAVSGFHVAIAAWLAMLLFQSGLLRIVGVSAVVWLYVVFAGAPAGGLRAAIMLQIYLLGLAVGRPSSGFNSVSAAGVLLLSWNPWYFFDVGWQLSMSAALFIAAAPPLAGKSWRSAAAVSMLVWLVTAPLVAYYFDDLPLAGLFVNMFAVPLFGLLFPAILACSLPSLLGLPLLAPLAAGVCEYFLEAWEILSGLIAGLLPWRIGFTPQLAVLGAVFFLSAAAYACGFFKLRSA